MLYIFSVRKESLAVKNGEMKVNIFDTLWEDAGTFDSLLHVSNVMAEKAKQQG